MTLAIRPADATLVAPDVQLASQYPDVGRWALGSYRRVANALPAVWPCQPDEERVRYYVWASRQVREAHAAVSEAWDALHSAFTILNALAEDLDEFERTGAVPQVTDDDLEGDRMASALPGTVEVARAPVRAPARKALPAPRVERRCSATTQAGKPCPTRPVNGSDRCLFHGGRSDDGR